MLLGEARAGEIETWFASASGVVCSELTLVECRRTLEIRAAAGLAVAGARARLELIAPLWDVADMSGVVLRSAEKRWPVEPARTLDAVHLATMVELRAAGEELTILTLDRRVRENALALGFPVLP